MFFYVNKNRNIDKKAYLKIKIIMISKTEILYYTFKYKDLNDFLHFML